MLVKPAPVDFMTSYIDGSDMWSNRIRKEFKGVDEDQIAFCVLFKSLTTELRAYVKEHHRTGLAWNSAGVPLAEYAGDGAAAVGPTATQSVPTAAPTASSSTPDVVDKGGLFASINAGGSVTAGLKKVTKDQQTWRAEFKEGASTPNPPPTAPQPKPVDKNSVATGPAKFELKADKWVVDCQTGAAGPLTVTISDIKQTVYIYKCDGASVTVVGKCKSIIVDSSRRVSLVFADLVAGLEIVNSRSSTVVCTNKLPSVAIDKCDGVHLTVSAAAIDVEVVASKSSEMNLAWPDPANPAELIERPIPEQYVHKIAGKSVTARVSDLYSH